MQKNIKELLAVSAIEVPKRNLELILWLGEIIEDQARKTKLLRKIAKSITKSIPVIAMPKVQNINSARGEGGVETIIICSNFDYYIQNPDIEISVEDYEFICEYIKSYQEVYLLSELVKRNKIVNSYKEVLKYTLMIDIAIERDTQPYKQIEITSKFWNDIITSKINFTLENQDKFFDLLKGFTKRDFSMIEKLKFLYQFRVLPDESQIYPLFDERESIDTFTNETIIFDPLETVKELKQVIENEAFKAPPEANIPAMPIIEHDVRSSLMRLKFHDNTLIESKAGTVISTESSLYVYDTESPVATNSNRNTEGFILPPASYVNGDAISVHGFADIGSAVQTFHKYWEISNRIPKTDFDIKKYAELIGYVGQFLDQRIYTKLKKTEELIGFWNEQIEKINEYRKDQMPEAIKLLKHIGLWEKIEEYKKTATPDEQMKYLLFDDSVIDGVIAFIREEIENLRDSEQI